MADITWRTNNYSEQTRAKVAVSVYRELDAFILKNRNNFCHNLITKVLAACLSRERFEFYSHISSRTRRTYVTVSDNIFLYSIYFFNRNGAIETGRRLFAMRLWVFEIWYIYSTQSASQKKLQWKGPRPSPIVWCMCLLWIFYGNTSYRLVHIRDHMPVWTGAPPQTWNSSN